MRSFLARRWFLVTLAAGCALAAALPAAMAWARSARPGWIMPAALFIVAWTMPTRRLLEAVRRPAASVCAAAVGFTLPPLFGWALGHLLTDDFRLGLAICCCVPCTLASAALWTRHAGGDEAAAILATFLSSGAGWLVTPALLALAVGRRVELDLPAMMLNLAAVLLLPVALGQLARAAPRLARFATKNRTALSVLSRLLVLVMLFRAAQEVSEHFQTGPGRVEPVELLLAAAACLTAHTLALAGGWLLASRLGFHRQARIAVAFCGSQKTLPVSLVLLYLYFPGRPLAVLPMVLYHAGQLIVDTLFADRWAAAPPPEAREWV